MTQPAAQSAIASAYNEWAETYDTDANRTRDLAAQVLRQSELSLSGRRVVEVGCGTGRNTAWLASAAFGASEILGLDFSEAMLERARERVQDPRVRFTQHDIRNPWPLANASADLVIAMLVLEHVEALEPFFAEAARVLNRSGEVFLCELHPMRQLLGGQAQYTRTASGERQFIPAFLHNVSEYVDAALSSGFELIKLAEWRDPDASATDLPRLLSLRLRVGGWD